MSTVPNARVDVLGAESIRVSWDPVYQEMVSHGTLLGFKIYYQSAGEPRRTIILVENVVQHVIPALSESLRLLLGVQMMIITPPLIGKWSIVMS